MSQHTLAVQNRKLSGRSVKNLRRQGMIPANIFGKNIPSLNIQVPTKEFTRLYREVGESTLIYLQLESEKTNRPVLVSDVTIHPVTGLLLHTGFHQVDLKEKVTAPVKIELTGESPAEKEKIGILVQQLHELEVEALPTDMPEEISVDISHLAEVDTAIFVKDLKLDSKLTIKTPVDTIIAKIEPPTKEEVEVKITPVEGEAAAGEAITPVEGAGEVTAESPKEEKSQ